MKILLILAAADNDPLRKNDPFMPLSLPLLAGSAPNHEYTFIDMLAGEPIDFECDAELIGISARATGETAAYQIADSFRNRGKTVILGGPQISAVYDRAIEHADACVIGEGEKLWPQIIDDYQHNALKKFYIAIPGPFDNKGLPFFQLPSFTDLSQDIPLEPLRKPYKRKYVFDTVFAARGCPVQCEFCSVTDLFGAKIRTRPIDSVVKEIAAFKGFYYLLDDTVFGRPSNYDYYCSLYDKITSETKGELWMGQANLDAAATKEGQKVIIKAAQAGLVYAAIGIESINTDVLQQSSPIDKTGALDSGDVIRRFEELISFIQQQGIFISGWFPVGFDGDSYETVRHNFRFCRKTGIAPVLSPLEALPGTRLFTRLSKSNRIDSKKPINIIHPQMEDKKLIEIIDTGMKKAYTLSEILRRSFSFARYANVHNKNINLKIKNYIKKTSFIIILQLKMRKGLYGLMNTLNQTST